MGQDMSLGSLCSGGGGGGVGGAAVTLVWLRILQSRRIAVEKVLENVGHWITDGKPSNPDMEMRVMYRKWSER